LSRQWASFQGRYVEVISEITAIETIAVGSQIRELVTLQRRYGRGRWRKRKGVGVVRVEHNFLALAELHWYEAHGIGVRRLKVKKLLEER
jgi:hypothetical protein